jgi:hypothetical protein
MKPTIIDVDGVRSWSDWLRPVMARVDLGRLCCAGNSGDAQYEFSLRKYAGQVGLTYKKYASENEVYPRYMQAGSVLNSDIHGAGTVVDSSYHADSSTWASTVTYFNGYSEVLHHPPQPILMFPDPTLIPTGSPAFEPMATDWPRKVHSIQSNIGKCEQHLHVFSSIAGVKEDWASWFANEAAKIAVCVAEATTPWCTEQSNLMITPTPAHDHGPVVLRSPQPPLTVPFVIDPVTHRDFTSADRATLQRSERATIAPGTMVVLRLKFGSPAPAHHKLPFCLAYVPESYVAAGHPDGSMVDFEVLFAKGADLTAVWTARLPSCTLMAPLRSVLISGISIIASRKLSAVSTAKITNILSQYDLSVV